MLRRLTLRDFVIVPTLELEFEAGFAALTGETGAGKSILLDALQLLLGGRGDAGVVREGSARAELSAEFDCPVPARAWLEEAGFASDELLLRRVIDAQGKSRAWINGSPATVAQLGEVGEFLIDIHGQHAWQKLTRPASVRALLDGFAEVESASLARTHAAWRAAQIALQAAQTQQDGLARERERLQWQLDEVGKLAPGEHEWEELNAEHQRLAHAQALIDASQLALGAVSESEDSAETRLHAAAQALREVVAFDADLQSALDALEGAQAQLDDAAHTLRAYLRGAEPDPDRLGQLDERLSSWMQLARRYRRPPAELPALQAQWRQELAALDAQSDLAALQAQVDAARKDFDRVATAASKLRRAQAPKLAKLVTQAMQQLGMAGGRLEIELLAQEQPQSFGLESAELLVAGHASATPRPLAKVASGGELSRIALAIAVCTARAEKAGAPTLIFDEIDAGVGGAVAETVGRLMQQLGRERQVLAVTHLPQVAACADAHWVVSKASSAVGVTSQVRPVRGEDRVQEIARMLGGATRSEAGLAHAQELLEGAAR
ncbi:DNA repair protein RecN (Recombination protein N) [Inhella inkyongensis]|uniref:DNA repair protein RecN n=1 Tax=Inhella inkyongensis TaxID=392593 RepID=A0A840S722_9BURK|nr:DNA repair protein RecN [Inhella inkyongensis]MBB5204584.1 DNA repair protein RecN (Recombination protein N) [Inhella inkyongensis]